MEGFADRLKRERLRRDAALEKAMDKGIRKGSPTPPAKQENSKSPVRHDKVPAQNKPHSITGGQDARSRQIRENARRIKELEGR